MDYEEIITAYMCNFSDIFSTIVYFPVIILGDLVNLFNDIACEETSSGILSKVRRVGSGI